jgi:hypothetical protein
MPSGHCDVSRRRQDARREPNQPLEGRLRHRRTEDRTRWPTRVLIKHDQLTDKRTGSLPPDPFYLIQRLSHPTVKWPRLLLSAGSDRYRRHELTIALPRMRSPACRAGGGCNDPRDGPTLACLGVRGGPILVSRRVHAAGRWGAAVRERSQRFDGRLRRGYSRFDDGHDRARGRRDRGVVRGHDRRQLGSGGPTG